tara:strand:- start:684 stop:854 length:171 start_codon:yes stop_codon:yes gene_type:complete
VYSYSSATDFTQKFFQENENLENTKKEKSCQLKIHNVKQDIKQHNVSSRTTNAKED